MSKTVTPTSVRRGKILGILLIVLPPIGLVFILSAFAITQFVINQVITEGASADAEMTANVIRIVLSFLGIICVIGVLVGVPLGIVLLRKRSPMYPEGQYDPRSGKGEQSDVPKEIQYWSWGAAGLGWIWGVYHNVWISLLNWVPIVNIFFWIVLALKGNEWAWRANQWKSVDEFNAAQRKWKPWGIGIFVIWAFFFVIQILASLASEL